jgi:hypothetical protein
LLLLIQVQSLPQPGKPRAMRAATGLLLGDVAAYPFWVHRPTVAHLIEGADEHCPRGNVSRPWPEPMLTLSLPSVARATRHPPLTSLTTSRSGTKTSRKRTSLNSDRPVIIIRGADFYARCVHVQGHHGDTLVLGYAEVYPDGHEAHPCNVTPLVHRFLTVDSPVALDARSAGFDPAPSEPASGSLNIWHQITSWSSAGQTQRRIWLSERC